MAIELIDGKPDAVSTSRIVSDLEHGRAVGGARGGLVQDRLRDSGAVLILLALVIAGCGGGDSESAARTSGCKHLAEAAQKFSAFATGRDSDLATFAEEFHDLAVFSFLTIVPGAPDEIRDDLQVLNDAFSRYLDAVADVDLGNLDQEALEKLQKPKPWTGSDLQKIRQASQNITAWTREKCLETP